MPIEEIQILLLNAGLEEVEFKENKHGFHRRSAYETKG